MRKFALITLIALGTVTLTTTGCVYRSSIVQGNDLDQRAIDRLEVGMSRETVRSLLGSPLVQDTYHPNRWDYVFYTKNLPQSQAPKRVTVYFDNIGNATKIEKPEQ